MKHRLTGANGENGENGADPETLFSPVEKQI
jgi:hypothetical protein